MNCGKAKSGLNSELVQNPEGTFDSPQRLVTARGLTVDEKLAALENWSFEVNSRLTAGNEGMPAPPGTASEDAELLREIGKAQLGLERVEVGKT